MPAHVYFDLDGTLTDPFEGISKCLIHAVSTLGFPEPSEAVLLDCIGPPLCETVPEIVGQDLTPQAIDLYRERFNELGWRENEPYDGIHDALDAIAESGCRLFVATSKPRQAALRIVEHFAMRPYFEAVYGSELDGTRSNKADLLAFAATENPGAKTTIMIGDRKHDLIGAIANRMTPIGVGWGYGSTEELLGAGAVAIAASPADLPSVIAGYA